MSISASAIAEAPIAAPSPIGGGVPGRTPRKRTTVATTADPLIPEPR